MKKSNWLANAWQLRKLVNSDNAFRKNLIPASNPKRVKPSLELFPRSPAWLVLDPAPIRTPLKKRKRKLLRKRLPRRNVPARPATVLAQRSSAHRRIKL